MDDQEQALNVDTEGNVLNPSPELENPKPEEVSEEKVEATAETQPKETETVESPKKGAEARIRELSAEKNQAKAEVKSLSDKLAELTGSVEPQVPQAPYNPQVEPGQELTQEQYKQDVLKTADSMVNLRLKQSEAITRINKESDEAVRSYPQLDPHSPDFDEELSNTVTEATEAIVKANPYTASVKKFVDKLMKPYQRSVTKEIGKETENIARQVSESALRPTSIQKTEKKFEELSIEEMEKQLGIVQS
jgi:hypothetical protein